MEGKHIVGVVSILVVGAIVVAVLVMRPWQRGEDRRDWHEQHDDQVAAQQAANAQATPQPQYPATPPVALPAPGVYDANGQALTVTFPTEDVVEVNEDNVWVPARITQREHDRVYVQYDGKGGKREEWVPPQRVRATHRR